VFYPGSGTHFDELAQGANRDLQAVILLIALITTFPAASLSHRVGRRPLIVAAGILGACGTVGLILSPYSILPGAMVEPVAHALKLSTNLAQTLYFGALVGICAGAFLSVDWAFLLDVIPPAEAGRFLGFSNIATAGSGVLARFIGGPIIDTFNARGHLLGQPGGYPVTFAVFVGFFVMGTLAILKVHETRGRRRSFPRRRCPRISDYLGRARPRNR
jgi:MFS family permease